MMKTLFKKALLDKAFYCFLMTLLYDLDIELDSSGYLIIGGRVLNVCPKIYTQAELDEDIAIFTTHPGLDLPTEIVKINLEQFDVSYFGNFNVKSSFEERISNAMTWFPFEKYELV